MHKHFWGPFVALLLVIAACGPQKAQGPTANTYTVQVDAGKGQAFPLAAIAYFPNEFKAHPGDTVQFKLVDSGEPHTVTFGTLADAAIQAIAKNAPPPGAPPPSGPPPPDPPELKKLPDLIPPPTGPQAPLEVTQSAAQPCYLSTGEPPAKDACSKQQQQQSDFDGKQTFYSSGSLQAEKTFSLKLSDSIRPGTYGYICLLHRAGMIGKVTVVDKNETIPGPDQVQSRGNEQLSRIVQKLQGPVDAANKATPDKAVAGAGSQDTQEALAAVFGPKDISIPVGGKVTWTVLGPHTISFNAPEDARPALLREAGGSVRINPKAFAPANSPGAPPPGPPPPGAPPGPPKPVVVDSGAWDGKGFRSSGFMLSFPPALISYSVQFTQAGTYKFKCLIHTDMEGTVKVG